MEVSGQLHAPSALPLDKSPPVPIGNDGVAPQCRSGRRVEDKFLAPAGIRTPAAHLLAHRYID
jgi:hypothetical protein